MKPLFRVACVLAALTSTTFAEAPVAKDKAKPTTTTPTKVKPDVKAGAKTSDAQEKGMFVNGKVVGGKKVDAAKPGGAKTSDAQEKGMFVNGKKADSTKPKPATPAVNPPSPDRTKVTPTPAKPAAK